MSETPTSHILLEPPVYAGDMLSGLLLEDAMLHNATKKADNPIDKTFFLAVLAGVWVGFSGTAALSAASGIPIEVQTNWPILPRLGLAAFFPFALHFIVMYGGELFTGNTMILAIGLYNRAVPYRRVVLNLVLVYLGNWCGCLLVSYFLAFLPGLFDSEASRTYLHNLTVAKTVSHGWGNLFLRGIPANALVCMAVMLGLAARDAAGKIMALWFPVAIFVLSGFEHSVANMYFLSTGLLYGAPSSIGRLFFNQSAVVLGNAVGGALVMAGTEHAMNHWRTVLPFETGGALGSGTLAAHDIESTRRAREDRGRPHRRASISMRDVETGRFRALARALTK